MRFLPQIPFAARDILPQLAVLCLLGWIIGGLLNLAIYRFSWNPLSISPWSAPPTKAPPRVHSDYIPILGWLGLRREAALHGKGFWIRPLLIELVCGVGFAWLFLSELRGDMVPGFAKPPATVMACQFVSHALLIALLIVATFIDFDEKSIPDSITIPGTLMAFALAAGWPRSLLSINSTKHLLLTSPRDWLLDLDKPVGLAIGIACIGCWCLALLPRTWWTRSGLKKALQYFFARIIRWDGTKLIFGMCLLCSIGVYLVWRGGGARWQSLLTALVGMAFSGGLVWSVRIVAGAALGREAMGFGDVTLMAMIGAFVGWQASLIVFFLAPFAGMVLAIGQWLVTRKPDIAYGPFLSIATLVLILRWPAIWTGWGMFFRLGWILPGLLACCLILMGLMLFVMRLLRSG